MDSVSLPEHKICNTCHVSKPLEAFSRHKGRKDGRLEQCKECRGLQRRKQYKEWATQPRIAKEGTKVCTSCGREKSLDEFCDSMDGKDGKTARCRVCLNEQCRAYKAEHHEEMVEYLRDYRKIEVEAMREARLADYQLLSEEERKALSDSRRPYLMLYNRKNRDTLRIKKLDYRKRNPVRMSNIRARRRARVANAPVSDLTPQEWLAIQEAQKYCCAYCGKRCPNGLTMDHITPLAKGGSHTLHNVIGACFSCNASKSARSVPKPVQPLLLAPPPGKLPTKNRHA